MLCVFCGEGQAKTTLVQYVSAQYIVTRADIHHVDISGSKGMRNAYRRKHSARDMRYVTHNNLDCDIEGQGAHSNKIEK